MTNNALGQTQEWRSNAIGQLVEITDHLGTAFASNSNSFVSLIELGAMGTDALEAHPPL